MPDTPEPMPPEGYDQTGLPAQPAHDSPRCHVCGGPRSQRHGALVCRLCDARPIA